MGQTSMEPCVRGGKQHGGSSRISLLRDQLGHKATGTVNSGDTSSSSFYLVLHNTLCSSGRSYSVSFYNSPCQSLSKSQPQFTLQIHMELYTYYHLYSELHNSLRMVNASSLGGKHIASPFIWVTEPNPHQIATAHPHFDMEMPPLSEQKLPFVVSASPAPCFKDSWG